MKRSLITIFSLTILCTINAADRPKPTQSQREIAEMWTSGYEFDYSDQDTKALAELLAVYQDSRLDHDALSKFADICEEHAINRELQHPVRVYARINLANTHKFLGMAAYGDCAAAARAYVARFNFVMALALARKSDKWRSGQEKMIADVQSDISNSMLREHYKKITQEEIDKQAEELERNQELQFQTVPFKIILADEVFNGTVDSRYL